jgi:spore coat polysaccharide biosynthesis protein SpsF
LKTAVFVQARVKSTRFPYKMLLPLAGKPLIQRCLNAARQIKADHYSILTTEEDAIYFEQVCKEENFDITTGPEHDVLQRFANGIEKYGVDTVVRITGDKAFLSPIHTQELIDSYLDFDFMFDFVYYDVTPYKETTGAPYKAEKIMEMNANPDALPEWREHVKPGFIANYRTQIMPKPVRYRTSLGNFTFTIDTPDDYRNVSRIYELLYQGKPIEVQDLEDLGRLFV